MRDRQIAKVIITTQYNDTIPEIYMVSGVITLDDSTGLLVKGWLSSLSSGAQIKSYGRYSEIKGGSIVLNSYSFINTLNDNNISISGAIIKIVTTINGVDYDSFYGEITGIPTLKKEKQILIKFEALERNRNALVTSLLPNSDDYYPVFYGAGKQKLINVESDEYIPALSSGAVPAFEVSSGGSFDPFLTVPVYSLLDISGAQASVFIGEIESYINDGYQLLFTANGNSLVIASYTVTYNLGGDLFSFDLVFQDGNLDPDNGGIKGLDRGIFSLVKNINYGDPHITNLSVSDTLYNYDKGFSELPAYSDLLQFSPNSINGVSISGVGYNRITGKATLIESLVPSWLDTSNFDYKGAGWWVGQSRGATGIVSGGDGGNDSDGDLSTYYEVKITADTFLDDFWNGFFIDVPPFKNGEIPNALYLTGKIEHAMTGEIGGSGSGNAAWDDLQIFVAIDNVYEQIDWTNVKQYDADGSYVVVNKDQFYGFLKNWFPPLKNGPEGVEGARNWRYKWSIREEYPPNTFTGAVDQNVNGFAIDILPLIDTSVGYELSAGARVYVRLNISSPIVEGNPVIKTNTMRFYDVSLIYPKDFDLSDIYINSTGRATNLRDMYRDALQRQNYKSMGITPPSEGWGLGIPSGVDWSTIYDDTSIDNLPDAEVYYQYGKVDTSTIKSDILKHTACMGAVSRDGLERVYNIASLLYDNTGPIIELSDNYTGKKNPTAEDQLPDIIEKQAADIYPRINVSYYSNVATDKTTKTISIVNVAEYGANSVVADELTDTEKRDIWGLANALYKGWGNVNTMPDSVGKTFIFKDKSAALEFINRTYALQGAKNVVYGENTLVDSFQRYVVNSKLYKKYVLENGIDNGTPVRVRRIGNSLITGVVTNLRDNGDYYTATIEAVGESLTGATEFVYIETGSADTEIIETGAQSTDIIEG